jgi:hypothetical protein
MTCVTRRNELAVCVDLGDVPAWGLTETCPREVFQAGTLSFAMTEPHRCRDCGLAPEIPLVYESGEMDGWLCTSCERKQRMRRMGCRRRTNHELRRLLEL